MSGHARLDSGHSILFRRVNGRNGRNSGGSPSIGIHSGGSPFRPVPGRRGGDQGEGEEGRKKAERREAGRGSGKAEQGEDGRIASTLSLPTSLIQYCTHTNHKIIFVTSSLYSEELIANDEDQICSIGNPTNILGKGKSYQESLLSAR